MCDIPEQIDPDEVIVRAVRHPLNFDGKQRMKPNIFRDAPGEDELSGMRKAHLGNDKCKALAKEKFPDAYRGFVAIKASEAVGADATVHDSRAEFCGHAHLSLGFKAPAKGDTAEPWQLDRYKKLFDIARKYLDPDVPAEAWTGPDMV